MERVSSGESMRDRMLRKKQQIDSARGYYWKPQKGENYVRILPSWKGPNEDFHYETPTHYRVGPNRRTVACIAQWGDVCPICQRAEKLAESADVEDQKRAASLMPRTRILMNVLVNNDPDGQVKIWSISPTLFSEFLSYYTNTQWGDFTNTKNGYNFTVTVKDSGRKLPDGNAISETEIMGDRESTAVGNPALKRKDLYNLEGVIAKNRYTRSEILAILRGEDVTR